MRYFNLGLSVVLFVLIGILFSKVSRLEKGTPTKEQAATFTESLPDALREPGSGLKIAFIELDSLVANYNLHKDLRKKLENKFKQAEGEFQNRVKSFEKDYKYLEQEAPRMSEEQLQRAQMDLARLEQSIMKMREEKMQELAEEEDRLNKKLKDDVDEVVGAMKRELGLDYIFLKEPSGVLIQANEAFDITKIVLERLNENYASKMGK
jgi:outer membrane protein